MVLHDFHTEPHKINKRNREIKSLLIAAPTEREGGSIFYRGKISETDKLNAIALSIYPFEDGTHLLFVRIYQALLSEVKTPKIKFIFTTSSRFI